MCEGEKTTDNIDRTALENRNEYIKRQKVNGDTIQKTTPRTVPNTSKPQITKPKAAQRNSGSESYKKDRQTPRNNKVGKNKKQQRTIRQEKENSIIAGSSEKKPSLLGQNNLSKKDEKVCSRILGKSRESAIKKKINNKSLRKYVSTASDSVNNTASKAKEQIRNMAMQTKIQDLMKSKNPSDAVAMLGEKGVDGAVKFSGMIIKFIIKTIGKVIAAAFSSFGMYIVIAVAAVMLILLIFTGVYVDIEIQMSSVANFQESGTVVGSVKQPRIKGTATELTYNDVYNSKWYSSYISGDGTYFAGQDGLDRMRGDRGGNCTAYAWGRRCELEGQRTELGAGGDAFSWYAREIASGIYKCGQSAKVGAVCCWSYGSDKYGHVAVIEKINKDGSIVTSNSAWGSHTGIPILFYNDCFASEDELKSYYGIFQGYIYLEKK